jgi:heat-inducible transcriptional repressor
MDDRKAEILRAIVEEYIETAQPVGSQTVARSSALGVSSATVRNDMTVLEREGYLVQPHTSAGRIPTDLGYRYFVDHFIRQRALPVAERRAVAEFFATAHSALEDLLHETSQLLARVTDHAGVVVGPPHDVAVVRSVQLVPLHPGVVLAVAVLSNGVVMKHTVHLTSEPDDARIAAASVVLNQHLAGRPINDRPETPATGDPEVDDLVGATRDGFAVQLAAGSGDPLYVGGTSRLATEQAFATADRAARLLELLEHQVVVVALVRELLDEGVNVSIGSENKVDELRDCAIVLAPYEIEGEIAGTVGILGPTRMDYQQALGAVAAVSDQLGRLLS